MLTIFWKIVNSAKFWSLGVDKRKSLPRNDLGSAGRAPRAVSPLVVTTYDDSGKLSQIRPFFVETPWQTADIMYNGKYERKDKNLHELLEAQAAIWQASYF